MEYIGSQAFSNCINLHGTLQIPSTLKHIGAKAFYDTDLKALSIPDNVEPGSISISPSDYDWFAKKAKIIQSNISKKESLDEDLLDENLPRDLALAYKNIGSYADLPNSQMHYLPGSSERRRYSRYDYKNSTYREITPQEASSLLSHSRGNAKYLRFLKNGRLIQFENNLPGEVHPIYGANVTITYTDRNGDRKTKSAKSCTMNQIVNNVDKIYYTDEYDHPLSQEKQDSRSDKMRSVSGIGGSRKKVTDTGRHELSDPMGLVIGYSDDSPVSVSSEEGEELTLSALQNNMRQYLGNYSSSIGARKKYSRLMNLLNNYKKNSELYDPEEYESIISTIKEKIKAIEAVYKDLRSKVLTGKKYINIAFDQNFIQRYKDAKESYERIQADISHYESIIKNSTNLLRDLKTSDITKTPEYRDLQNEVTKSENAVNSLKQEQATLKSNMDIWQAQILELQQKIEAADKRSSQIADEALPEAIENAAKVRDQIDDQIEELSEKTAQKITDAENALLDAQRWFNDNPAAGKRFSLPNTPEMKPEVAAKLRKRETRQPQPDANDKFGGLSFTQLKEIFNHNFDEDYVDLTYDEDGPFVTPFFDSSARSEFNSFDELYRYWESEEGLSNQEVDE